MSKKRMFKIHNSAWARGVSWEWGKLPAITFDGLRLNLSPYEINMAEQMGVIEEITDGQEPDPGITMVAPAIVPPVTTPKKKRRGRPRKNES
jgi:hypothetical protein